jgi:hypothetical protein
MKEVAITEAGDGSKYFLSLPDYSDGFRKAMVERIPASERGWNPEKKQWWVSALWLEFAEGLVVEFFPHAEVNFYGA